MRQPQTRSVTTRARLIQAALDEIFAVGYHAATTHQIAIRAQVSRGALLHHFPARADLIQAAMETLLRDGTAQIRAESENVRDGRMPLADFVEFLLGLFSGRFFYLSLEMITEARNDADLKGRMVPVVQAFHAALDEIWVQFCESGKRPPREARIILNLTLCLVRGMGVQMVLRPEPGYYRDMIEAWKALLPNLVAGPAGDAMFAGDVFRR